MTKLDRGCSGRGRGDVALVEPKAGFLVRAGEGGGRWCDVDGEDRGVGIEEGTDGGKADARGGASYDGD